MKKIFEIFFIIFILAVFIESIFLLKGKYAGNIKTTSAKIQSDNIQIQDLTEQTAASEPQVKNKKTVKILFTGDLMFDRYIREISQKKGNDYIFDKIRKLLATEDLTITNLEGPITDNASLSAGTLPGEKHHLIFTFDPILAKTLYEKNIKLVNIGNNHILNFGQDGIDQTETSLKNAGIEYFGSAGSLDKDIVKNINGHKIGFVNYNQFICRDALQCVSTAVENIKNLKHQSDTVIVYTHWGTEYKTDVSQSLKNLGHQFIDSGADLVIGTHPHVVEPKEEYKGHWIYYSLGNFIFDQYFSPETKKGLAVEVTINPGNKTEYRDIPLALDNNGQTRISGL
jgi:gamma-polyglutamate biosynthesis protein CapA